MKVIRFPSETFFVPSFICKDTNPLRGVFFLTRTFKKRFYSRPSHLRSNN